MASTEFETNRAALVADRGRLFGVTEEWPETFDVARALMEGAGETYRTLLRDVRGLHGEARDALEDCIEMAREIVPLQDELRKAEKARNKDKIKELEKKIAPLDKKAQKRFAEYDGFCKQVNDGYHQDAIKAATPLSAL